METENRPSHRIPGTTGSETEQDALSVGHKKKTCRLKKRSIETLRSGKNRVYLKRKTRRTGPQGKHISLRKTPGKRTGKGRCRLQEKRGGSRRKTRSQVCHPTGSTGRTLTGEKKKKTGGNCHLGSKGQKRGYYHRRTEEAQRSVKG